MGNLINRIIAGMKRSEQSGNSRLPGSRGMNLFSAIIPLEVSPSLKALMKIIIANDSAGGTGIPVHNAGKIYSRLKWKWKENTRAISQARLTGTISLTHYHQLFRCGRVDCHGIVKILLGVAHFDGDGKTLQQLIYTETDAVQTHYFLLRADANQFHTARLTLPGNRGVHGSKRRLVDFHISFNVFFLGFWLSQINGLNQRVNGKLLFILQRQRQDAVRVFRHRSRHRAGMWRWPFSCILSTNVSTMSRSKLRRGACLRTKRWV